MAVSARQGQGNQPARCPACGNSVKPDQGKIGGKGYVTFTRCVDSTNWVPGRDGVADRKCSWTSLEGGNQ